MWVGERGIDFEPGWAEPWVQGFCIAGVGSSWCGLSFGFGSSCGRLRGMDDVQVQEGVCLKEMRALLDWKNKVSMSGHN